MLKIKITFFLFLALVSICQIELRTIKRSNSDLDIDDDDRDLEHDHDEENDTGNTILPLFSSLSNDAYVNSTNDPTNAPTNDPTNAPTNQSTRPSELLQMIFNELFQSVREFLLKFENNTAKLTTNHRIDQQEFVTLLTNNILVMIKRIDEMLKEYNNIIKNMSQSDLNKFRESVSNQTLGTILIRYKENINTTLQDIERRYFDSLLNQHRYQSICGYISHRQLAELETHLRKMLRNFDSHLKSDVIKETFRYKSIFFDALTSIGSFLFTNSEFQRLSCFYESNSTIWEIREQKFREYLNDFISYYKCWTKEQVILDESKGILYTLGNRVKNLNCRENGSFEKLKNELNKNYSYFNWDVEQNRFILHGNLVDFKVIRVINTNTFAVLNRETNCDLNVSYEDIDSNLEINNHTSRACRQFDFSNFLQFFREEFLGNNETSSISEQESMSVNSFEQVSYEKISNEFITDFTNTEELLYVPAQGILKGLSVEVNINHPYIGDLKVYLIAPNRNEITLHDRSGGSNDDLVGNYPNTLTPVDSLQTLNGMQIHGNWLLRVYDGSRGDTGKLNSWKLNIKYSRDVETTNSTTNLTSNDYQTSLFSSTNNFQKSIEDYMSIFDSIFVPHSGYLTSVNIDVRIRHTATSDLEVYLQAPNGIKSKLHSRSSGVDIIGNYPKTIGPAESLSSFYRSQVYGNWFIIIKDSVRGDVGRLESWSLHLQYEKVLDNSTNTDVNQTLNTSSNIAVENSQTVISNGQSPNTFSWRSSPNEPIQDLMTVDDSIDVPIEGFLASINIDVNISHSHVGDLIVHLITPSMQYSEVILHDRTGGSSDNLLGNYPHNLTSVTSLNGIIGVQVRGRWILRVKDASSGDKGIFHSWKLNIQYSTTNFSPITTRLATTVDYMIPNTARTNTTINEYTTERLHSVPSHNRTAARGSENYFSMEKTPTSSINSYSTINDSIYVPNAGQLRSINLDIDITHTHVGDLLIHLIAPNGKNVTLHNRSGGSNKYLRGNYPTTITPYESFNEQLVGTSIRGNWILRVFDAASGDSGTLNSWKLNIEFDTLATTRSRPNEDEDGDGATDDSRIFDLLKELVKSKINLATLSNQSMPSSVNINFYNLFYKNKLHISNQPN